MFEFFAGIYFFTAGVFAFGTLMFWVALLLLTGLIFWCDDRESTILGTFTVLATVFLFNASGILPISSFASFVGGAVLYLVIGTLWSVVKWYFYLPRKKEELLKLKAEFIAKHNERITRHAEDEAALNKNHKGRGNYRPVTLDGVPYMETISPDVSESLPSEVRMHFREHLTNNNYFGRYYDNSTKIIPIASDNKLRITGWITYWPWSAAWTLINEPVRKAVKFIWIKMSSTYQRIADSAFDGVADDEEV